MDRGAYFERIADLGRIRSTLLNNQPSDRAIAGKIGVSPTTVGDWLKGRRFPQCVDTLVALIGVVRTNVIRQGQLDVVPSSLLDENAWKTAHEAEAKRRADVDSVSARASRARRALSDLTPGEPIAAERPPGRPIKDIAPNEVEIRVANHDDTPPGLPELPAYVDRDHDRQLRAVVERAMSGQSSLVVLVSDSTSGKTRACYEALHHRDQDSRSLADAGWRLWPPLPYFDSQMMLDEMPRVGPHTVVWLNEAQRYLLDPPIPIRDQIASGLRELLTERSRGPVLLLGTLWPEYWTKLTRRPEFGERDTHDAARVLLQDGRGIYVPATFTAEDRARARETRDPRMVDAADHAVDGALVQYIAGVPDLVKRFTLAGAAERALIEAAMDARRLGHGEWIPAVLLHDAAAAYLSVPERRLVRQAPEWCADAVAELCRLGVGQSCVLEPHPDDINLQPMTRRYRLEDYLDQYGRRTRSHICPAQPFWDAVHHHTSTPGQLIELASAAHDRHRLQIAAQLRRHGKPAVVDRVAPDADALVELTLAEERAGDHEMAIMLALHAAEAGCPDALIRLAQVRDEAADHVEAELLYRTAAGDSRAAFDLGRYQTRSGSRMEAERRHSITNDAAADGDADALVALAWHQERSGDHAAAELFAIRAADAGRSDALIGLAYKQSLGHERSQRVLQFGLNANGSVSSPW